MKLESFISDLLYRFDLVIIPDFGGIVSRKKSARFDRDSFIFSPPHKELSFNSQIKENDGLLANYVSDIMGVSYNDALKFIADEVHNWQETLKKEKRLKINQIGIFNLVNDDKIIFLPLTTKNYLAEAYGLTSFVHKPLIKQEQIIRQEQQTSIPVAEPLDPSIKKQVERPKVYKKSPKKVHQQNDYKLWKYAAVFVVGLGLFTAGIGWIKSQNHIAEPQFQKATFVLKKDFPVVTVNTPLTKEDKTVSTLPVEKKYSVISGAFRNKNNAEKKVKYLQKAGFDAKIIGQNKYGLWMVSLKDFATKEEATKSINKLKKIQPGAWVFEKK